MSVLPKAASECCNRSVTGSITSTAAIPASWATFHDDIPTEAARKLKCGTVIEATDVCFKSGFTQVGFLPPTDLGK